MLTQAKAAREAGHPKVVEEREPYPDATPEQIADLEDYLRKFKENLPDSVRQVKQLESYLEQDLTQPNAAEILHNLKMLESEK
jgi:hypothetical protein